MLKKPVSTFFQDFVVTAACQKNSLISIRSRGQKNVGDALSKLLSVCRAPAMLQHSATRHVHESCRGLFVENGMKKKISKSTDSKLLDK